MVQDRVVAMMKVELLTWVEARVQVCVEAMMNTAAVQGSSQDADHDICQLG